MEQRTYRSICTPFFRIFAGKEDRMGGNYGPRHKYDRSTLLKMIREEPFDRVEFSFYRYTELSHPDCLKEELYEEWSRLGVLGRVYLSREGINAQVSVPEPEKDRFKTVLDQRPAFQNMALRPAIEHRNDAFLKLRIKVRPKLVADGIPEGSLDLEQGPGHLSPEEFHRAMEEKDSIVVDMRNHYESEVGRFKGALTPESETFREELPQVHRALKGQEDKRILLYCTGGIRCEKAGAYLRQQGFKKVEQLEGGIIEYARRMKEIDEIPKFYGKNFVFDERLGERVTDDVIARCHQCGKACDRQVNCRYEGCNLLFIQCEDCERKWEHCCSPECKEMTHLSPEERREHRKGQNPKRRFNKGKRGRNELAERVGRS
ncbi:MAG: rhodanese-related sulfurtransferase [Flavobacteriales bacterium]